MSLWEFYVDEVFIPLAIVIAVCVISYKVGRENGQMNASNYWISQVEEQRKANEKLTRHFNILLQLGYDYQSHLELFEDEESQERAEHVGNILTRMEGYYGVSTRTKTLPQQARTQKESKDQLFSGNDSKNI